VTVSSQHSKNYCDIPVDVLSLLSPVTFQRLRPPVEEGLTNSNTSMLKHYSPS
jgi:hypothetical protein